MRTIHYVTSEENVIEKVKNSLDICPVCQNPSQSSLTNMLKFSSNCIGNHLVCEICFWRHICTKEHNFTCMICGIRRSEDSGKCLFLIFHHLAYF